MERFFFAAGVFLFIALLCANIAYVAAQDVPQAEAEPEDNIDLTGSFPPGVIVPKVIVPLRESPPGFFKGKGDIVAQASDGNAYVQLDTRTIWGLTGSQTWIKLRSIEDGTIGWAYGGTRAGEFNDLFQSYELPRDPAL